MKAKKIVSLVLSVLMVCSLFTGLGITASAETEHTYTVAGQSGLCGSNWSATDTENDMTLQEDGSYAKVYENPTPGDYELKVVQDHSWDVNYTSQELMNPNNGNVSFTVPEGTKEVKVVLRGTNVEVYVDEAAAEKPTEPEETYHVVAGDVKLCNGVEWDPKSDENKMSVNADGDFEITYENVAAGSYDYKVTTNGNWDPAYGPEGIIYSGNATLTVTEEQAPATVKMVFSETTKIVTITITPGEGEEETSTTDEEETSTTDEEETSTTDEEETSTTEPEEDTSTTEPEEDTSSTSPEAETVHYVAGSVDLCNGVSWDQTAEVNKMTVDEDGNYTITFENIPAGDYQFKVTTNGEWEPAYGTEGKIWPGGEGSTISITEEQGTSNVTITFNEETEIATVTITPVGDTPSSETEPTVTDPSETDPSETDPSETDPSETDPSETDPSETDPSLTEPTVTVPSETDPSETDPSVTDPSETDPSVTDPSETDPSETDPSVTEPTVTDPSETDPSETDPTVTDPSVTDPSETDPSETDPSETDPQPTAPEGTYHVVAGDQGLCNGVNWSPSALVNLMTSTGEGTYEITFANVSAGTYQFKVTTDGAWNNPEYNLTGSANNGAPNAEIVITDEQAPATVKVTFSEAEGFARAYINDVEVEVERESKPSETDPSDPTITDPTVTDPTVTDPTVTDPTVTDPTNPTVTDPTTPSTTEPTTIKPVAKTTVKLAKTSGKVYVKGTVKIKATVKNGKGATTYKSANTKIAKVSSKGVVTGVKAGKTTITVKNNGVSKKFTITVMRPVVKIVKSIKAGKKATIKITGKVGKVTFKTSKKKILTVSKKGVISAKKKGTAIVTVKTNGIKFKVKVKVK